MCVAIAIYCDTYVRFVFSVTIRDPQGREWSMEDDTGGTWVFPPKDGDAERMMQNAIHWVAYVLLGSYQIRGSDVVSMHARSATWQTPDGRFHHHALDLLIHSQDLPSRR